jgi:hypothetical protein
VSSFSAAALPLLFSAIAGNRLWLYHDLIDVDRDGETAKARKRPRFPRFLKLAWFFDGLPHSS